MQAVAFLILPLFRSSAARFRDPKSAKSRHPGIAIISDSIGKLIRKLHSYKRYSILFHSLLSAL